MGRTASRQALLLPQAQAQLLKYGKKLRLYIKYTFIYGMKRKQLPVPYALFAITNNIQKITSTQCAVNIITKELNKCPLISLTSPQTDS